MKTLFFYYKTFTFRPPLCKKLELYEAPNSPSVRLKVSYYHRCLYREKLRTTKRGFPLFVYRGDEALASSELHLFCSYRLHSVWKTLH